jgi:hypothetical protein
VATQLDPLDTLLVTALVFEIAADLEEARVLATDNIVHSYRFAPTTGGQLYDPQWSFDTFRSRSLEIAREKSGYVLMTDIADFFPRIYLHRLENALAVFTSHHDHTRVIGKLISGLNQSVSYGLPVGPAIFRLLAEITIDDVDRALLTEGYEFCRFSDDYRIFVPDERRAREACAYIANILLRHHGLTLQESKTEIIPAEEFWQRFERTEEDAERDSMRQRFDELRRQLEEQEAIIHASDPFSWDFLVVGDPYVQIDYEDLSPEQQAVVDGLNLWEVLKEQLAGDGALDVPLTRFVLRRIAQLGLQDRDGLLLSDLARLYPVFPNVIGAAAVQFPDDLTQRQTFGATLLELFDHPIVGHLEYHRAWILSVFADSTWDQTSKLVQLYAAYADQMTRPEIVTALGAANLAHWFRGRKQDVTMLPPWERRAFLAAARCLPSDEGKHWYRSVMPQLDILDQTVARWALRQL